MSKEGPSYTEIEGWIRQHETPFIDAFRAYTDNLIALGSKDLGYDEILNTDGTSRRIFTGKFLCKNATFIMHEAINQNFGKRAKLSIIHRPGIVCINTVEKDEAKPDSLKWMRHYMLRFGKKRDQGTVDPTYGQVDIQRNGILVYPTHEEASFYADLYYPEIVTGELKNWHRIHVDSFSDLPDEDIRDRVIDSYNSVYIALGAKPLPVKQAQVV